MSFELREYMHRPLVSVFRRVHMENVSEYVEQLVSAGFPLIEVTMDSPDWLAVSKKITSGGGIWGAGTVMNPEQVAQAADAGANFMMSPVCESQVIDAGSRTGIPFIPGCMTPSEINMAVKAGATAVKVFPAVSIGIEGIASLRGPFPEIPIVATGGVTLGNAATYLKAGATFIGIGTSLFKNPALVDSELQAFRDSLAEIQDR